MTSLQTIARQEIQHRVRPLTRNCYDGCFKFFLQFCTDKDVTPLPASEDTLLAFFALLSNVLNYKPSTLKNYRAAIVDAHAEHGFPHPINNRPSLQALFRANRNKQPPRDQDDKRRGFTDDQLQQLWDKEDLSDANTRVLFTAVIMGHCGLLRAGEITASHQLPIQEVLNKRIRVKDVKPHFEKGSLTHLSIWLRHAKTDSNDEGQPVFMGCNGQPRCGACLTHELLQHHHQQGSAPDDAFLQYDKNPLSYITLLGYIKDSARALGLDERFYSGHSLRIGGATSLAQMDTPAWRLKAMGRWKGTTYMRYIREAELQKNATITQLFTKQREKDQQE